MALVKSTAAGHDLGPHLLQIAPEIRLCIYELTLVVDAPITPVRRKHPGSIRIKSRSGRLTDFRKNLDDKPYASHPVSALLMTCRKIYNEASGLYYRKNRFAFSNSFVLDEFLKSVEPSCQAEICELVICSAGYPGWGHRGTTVWDFSSVLAKSNLASFTVTLELPWGQWLDGDDKEHLQELMYMEKVKELKIRRKDVSSQWSNSAIAGMQIQRPPTSPERDLMLLKDNVIEGIMNKRPTVIPMQFTDWD
ncbi:MAG: hypothetical protein M1835_005711 [Candelina submexicana]|nr:MAG: hypothetical protein M1835_005711 [Candelina submexicana]